MRAGKPDLPCRYCEGIGDLKWLIVHRHDGKPDSRILTWLWNIAAPKDKP